MNDEIDNLIKEYRNKTIKIQLKTIGIIYLSAIPIVAVCLLLDVLATNAPMVLAIFTSFFIFFKYTMPRMEKVSTEYKTKVTDQLLKETNKD